MKKIVVFALMAVLSLGLLTACGGGGGKADQTIDVTMGPNGEMKFEPGTITAKKGQTVQINLKNVDAAQAHSLIIPGLENAKSKQVPAGKTDTMTFKADKDGEFEFYCDVPGHKEGGMTGKITVTP